MPEESPPTIPRIQELEGANLASREAFEDEGSTVICLLHPVQGRAGKSFARCVHFAGSLSL